MGTAKVKKTKKKQKKTRVVRGIGGKVSIRLKGERLLVRVTGRLGKIIIIIIILYYKSLKLYIITKRENACERVAIVHLYF